jgi:hypothetical protein
MAKIGFCLRRDAPVTGRGKGSNQDWSKVARAEGRWRNLEPRSDGIQAPGGSEVAKIGFGVAKGGSDDREQVRGRFVPCRFCSLCCVCFSLGTRRSRAVGREVG